MIRHTFYLSAFSLLAFSLLQGCKVGPDYVGPKPRVLLSSMSMKKNGTHKCAMA